MNEENQAQNGIFANIDILKLLQACWKKLWLILLCAAIGAGAMYYYTDNYITPLYSASVTAYINSNRSYGYTYTEDEESGMNNVSLARSLTSTYVAIMKTEKVLDEVAKQLGSEYTAARLSGMISVAQVGKTELFTITVTSSDPTEAARIANIAVEVGPKIVAEMLEGSVAYALDYATVPTAPYYPSVMHNTLMGGGIGAAVALIFILLLFLLDVRIKDEDELLSLFDYPILGRIPDFEQVGSSSSRKTGKKYGYNELSESSGSFREPHSVPSATYAPPQKSEQTPITTEFGGKQQEGQV